MPTPLPQTCFGSLVFLRNSYSRITGPSIRRHLGVVRTTSITNLNSHRSYTSITPRSPHRHRYRVQPNHPTHQTEYQPSSNSERPPQSQPSLQNDFHKREKFVRRRRKDEEVDGVRGGFRGMSWKDSGLPPPLPTRLAQVFPLARNPTEGQAEFLSAVLLGKGKGNGNGNGKGKGKGNVKDKRDVKRDVFWKEGTGRGKTLALVLFALAHYLNLQGLGRPGRSGDCYDHKPDSHFESNSNSTPSSAASFQGEKRVKQKEGLSIAAGKFEGPTFLLLLPNTTLLAQVERWLEAIYPNPLSDPNFGVPDPGASGNGNRIYRTEQEEGGGGEAARGKVWECVYPRTRSKKGDKDRDVKDDRVSDFGVQRRGGEERGIKPTNDLDVGLLGLAPSILVSTPSALWDRLQLQSPPSHFESKADQEAGWLTVDRLRNSLEVVAMDEPDAIIRPLPGRYDQQQQAGGRYGGKPNVFHRHPPVGVKLLEALLPGRPEARRHASYKGTHGTAYGDLVGRKKVQTVWTSATVNSQLRGYIVKRGWARPRGEGGVVLEYSGASETNDIERNGKGRGGQAVEHVCWVVDPDSGEHTNLSEPVALDGSTGNDSRAGMMTKGDESQEAPAVTAPGPGEVHPYLIESLALHWASRSGSGKSLVIPPNGTSVRKLQDTLSELGCPSVSLDVDSRETARQVGLALQEGQDRLDDSDEETFEEDGSETKDVGSELEKAKQDTLYILPRSHIRGIDIPDIKTVYLLGGLGNKDAKGGSTGAAVWAEREREYLHWIGRMGRLSGTKVGEIRDDTTEGDTIVTLVLKGPEEILMRKFMEKMKEKRQEAMV